MHHYSHYCDNTEIDFDTFELSITSANVTLASTKILFSPVLYSLLSLYKTNTYKERCLTLQIRKKNTWYNHKNHNSTENLMCCLAGGKY